MLVESYAKSKLKKYILQSVKINLFPSLLTENAKKLGLLDEIDVDDILQAVSTGIPPNEYKNTGSFQKLSKSVKDMVEECKLKHDQKKAAALKKYDKESLIGKQGRWIC